MDSELIRHVLRHDSKHNEQSSKTRARSTTAADSSTRRLPIVQRGASFVPELKHSNGGSVTNIQGVAMSLWDKNETIASSASP